MQEESDNGEEYLKAHPELTKALTALFEHFIQVSLNSSPKFPGQPDKRITEGWP